MFAMQKSFVVVEYQYEGNEFEVVLRREEELYVIEAKELIINKLKKTRPSMFDDVHVDWLTLKKSDGSPITDKRMPPGEEFLATLVRNRGKFLLYGKWPVQTEIRMDCLLSHQSYLLTGPSNPLDPCRNLPLDPCRNLQKSQAFCLLSFRFYYSGSHQMLPSKTFLKLFVPVQTPNRNNNSSGSCF
jgi:hypothetical protein